MLWNELTPRQQEIMRMLATGSSNAEIADSLDLSLPTVRNVIAEVYKANGFHNRVQAMLWVLGQDANVLEAVMAA